MSENLTGTDLKKIYHNNSILQPLYNSVSKRKSTICVNTFSFITYIADYNNLEEWCEFALKLISRLVFSTTDSYRIVSKC